MCDEVLDVRADKDEAHRYIERLTVTPNKNRHALNKALTLDLQRGGERLTFAVPDPSVALDRRTTEGWATEARHRRRRTRSARGWAGDAP